MSRVATRDHATAASIWCLDAKFARLAVGVAERLGGIVDASQAARGRRSNAHHQGSLLAMKSVGLISTAKGRQREQPSITNTLAPFASRERR
jgi:hypothetical protein